MQLAIFFRLDQLLVLHRFLELLLLFFERLLVIPLELLQPIACRTVAPGSFGRADTPAAYARAAPSSLRTLTATPVLGIPVLIHDFDLHGQAVVAAHVPAAHCLAVAGAREPGSHRLLVLPLGRDYLLQLLDLEVEVLVLALLGLAEEAQLLRRRVQLRAMLLRVHQLRAQRGYRDLVGPQDSIPLVQALVALMDRCVPRLQGIVAVSDGHLELARQFPLGRVASRARLVPGSWCSALLKLMQKVLLVRDQFLVIPLQRLYAVKEVVVML
mmetsp:Transcript_63676/g.179227  ORF Transcript_63676/g.179227 Transcript_63676/m.179227 type:complete len:270 (+) Transcript_63676:535-1344(+)